MASTPSANLPGQGQARSSAAQPASSSQPSASQNAQAAQGDQDAQKPKKKKHRAGKKRRNRRQSFAAGSDNASTAGIEATGPNFLDVPRNSAARSSFYRIGEAGRSNTSLESEALLDHRDQSPLQTRRQSIQQAMLGRGSSQPYMQQPRQPRAFRSMQQGASGLGRQMMRTSQNDEDDNEETSDRTPLISSSQRESPPTTRGGYGGLSAPSVSSGLQERSRRRSLSSGSRRRAVFEYPQQSSTSLGQDWDVNNPPSVPGSPVMGAREDFEDVMIPGDVDDRDISPGSPTDQRPRSHGRDALIDIDEEGRQLEFSTTPSPTKFIEHPAETDVCFPQEGMSEFGQDDQESVYRRRRRRPKHWPDLSVLEEWAQEEKEQRTQEGIRARRMTEPLMVGGRLRPQKRAWHREEEDAPYRFTYFNEEFESTIHSQSISELPQQGQSFQALFVPDPPELSDSESEDEDFRTTPNQERQDRENGPERKDRNSSLASQPQTLNLMSRASPRTGENNHKQGSSNDRSGQTTPHPTMNGKEKPKRYGERPVFWLDVLNPTDQEMRVLGRAFGIHALTIEDIKMQEAREKVELFRNYYFVNYRTFEQDTNSDDYLEPINMYMVVFREGVITFHFSMIPHPANVRRRIRQLRDYLILSSDWISYAIIDDITDVYAPLIQTIEEEVDDIDDAIMSLHSPPSEEESKYKASLNDEKRSEGGEESKAEKGADMFRRVGECRKRVMSLYRLLGNKADVIKGFAKRCNEQWEVAPRSEIGYYLGDIQDHIVTMTQNLSHYENLLSRAHSNYLAQINIRMMERGEQTTDILNKLTVLGTIVLPMNIITGMWGMNVWVPGQEYEGDYTWFFAITVGLLLFGISCYVAVKKVWGVV